MGRARRQTVPHALEAADARRLADEGWLRLPAVVSPREVAGLHAAWERRATMPAGTDSVAEHNWGPSGLDSEPEYAALVAHPRVRAAVAILIGQDFAASGCHGRAPPPGHGQQGLHVDWPGAVAPEEQWLANAFYVLDPMDQDNGATRLVPGSHRWARVPRGSFAQPHGEHPREVRAVAAPGDVLVFSAHLWHAGARNHSGRRRRVAIAQFARPRDA